MISASRASLARLWNHRERAWWRRVHASQWMTSHRGRARVVRAASSRLISGMVSGIMPGSGGGGCAGPDRGRCLGVGAVLDQGGGDGADGQGGHHQHGVACDRGVEPGLALVKAEAVLAERGGVNRAARCQPGLVLFRAVSRRTGRARFPGISALQ